ncbi:MAG TPA: hypothetical protein VE344_02370 [Methylomirabilota bacterium]|nr:hypothetical protein [Methylomirabilota bacterium]
MNGEFWILFWATIGAIIVFVGLVLEKFADWLNEKFLGGYKPHKTLETFGWFLLMFGIYIEIVDAGWSANDAWQTRQMANPWNGPISEISARAFISVKDDSTPDLPTQGSPRIASLALCQNDVEAKFDATHFGFLDADKFVRSGSVLIGNDTVRKRGYSLIFNSEGNLVMDSGTGIPIKEIENVKVVRMDLKFLAKDSEILGGKVQVVVNGKILGNFQILPQIDTNVWSEADPLYVVFATNGVWIPKK